MKFQFSIISFLCFALLAACSKPASRNSQGYECVDGELKTVGVFGGKTLSSDSIIAKGTVFIRQDAVKDGKAVYIGCTGSLIDKNIVLTAAHCVPQNLDASTLLIAFSVDPICQIDKGSSDLRAVEKILIHPKYNEDNLQFDIALLRFEGSAPDGTIPLKLEMEKTKLSTQSEIFVAGFGKTTDYNLDDPSTTQLRAAQVKTAQVDSARASTYSTDQEVLYFDQRNGQGACQGDSGGPVFLKKGGQLSIIGVVSGGDSLGEESWKDEKQISCKLGMRATSVQAEKSWLKSAYFELINFNSSGKLF